MIKLYDGHITDILPAGLANDNEVKALSYSINKTMRRFLNKLNSALILLDIDSLDEDVLDARAVELNTPYYDETLPIEKKKITCSKNNSIVSKSRNASGS